MTCRSAAASARITAREPSLTRMISRRRHPRRRGQRRWPDGGTQAGSRSSAGHASVLLASESCQVIGSRPPSAIVSSALGRQCHGRLYGWARCRPISADSGEMAISAGRTREGVAAREAFETSRRYKPEISSPFSSRAHGSAGHLTSDDHPFRSGAVEKTRTSTGFPPQAPQACASTIPPRPHHMGTALLLAPAGGAV